MRYVVGDEIMSLLPGEYQRLDGQVQRKVTFHRGGELDDCSLPLTAGIYVFSVGDLGWELTQPPLESALRILATCQPAAPPVRPSQE